MVNGEAAQRKATHPAVVATIAVALLFGIAFLQRRFTSNRWVGRPAPDFALDLVSEDKASLGDRLHLSELRGKTVLLDFWATWCEPCQVVAPRLQRVAQKHHDDLVVVGVNTSDEPGFAPVFAKKKGLSYPMVYDKGDEVAHKYGVTNLPTLVVINAKGDITAVQSGVESETDIEELIRDAQ